MQMFERKMISAYGATAAIAIFMGCWMSDGYVTGHDLLALIRGIAFIASPVLFLYGSIISTLLELATNKIPIRSAGLLVSAQGHAALARSSHPLSGWQHRFSKWLLQQPPSSISSSICCSS